MSIPHFVKITIAQLSDCNSDSMIHHREVITMMKPKFKFSYDEIRIIVLALVELKNQLIAEGRYTDAVDDLLIKLVD